jgi:hypothetical protein
MATITVNANTNIVLVNTASGNQTTVNLPPVTPGQLITIRDNVGAASSNNPITITTIGGTVFSAGTVLPDGNNQITIRQPFGAVTVGYSGGLKWNILNTFAFENPTFASVDAVTVKSVTFRDLAGSGDNYLLNVSNDNLYKDGIRIIEAPEFNSGIARHDGGISSLSSIVSYGLSTVAAQPHYGLSSLSSIVSYGLSSLVGASGGDGTPSNWAAYPAISNVDMSNFSITNLSNLTLSGIINFPDDVTFSVTDGGEILINNTPFLATTDPDPKIDSITLGSTEDNIVINTNIIIDNKKYLTLNAPTYINGTLTVSDILYLADSNITGPPGSVLSYNDVPIGGGGGDPSTWATHPASTDVNMANHNILNVANIQMGYPDSNIELSFQTNTDGEDPTHYLSVDGNVSIAGLLTITDGTNSTTISSTSLNVSNWATYQATSNLDMGGSNISNVDNLTVNSLTLNEYTFTTLVNPVGAYIEIHNLNTGSYTTYPLHIKDENAVDPTYITPTAGWWTAQGGTPRFKGIILLPNYTISYTATSDQEPSIVVNNVNIIPTYIVLSNDATNELDYRASLYYQLTYNPT